MTQTDPKETSGDEADRGVGHSGRGGERVFETDLRTEGSGASPINHCSPLYSLTHDTDVNDKEVGKSEGNVKKQKRSFLLFDGKKFHDFFNQNESGDPAKDTCGILTVEGRTFPVDVFYTVR